MSKVQEDMSVCVEDDRFQFVAEQFPLVKRKIVTAANRHRDTGLIIVGARHWSDAMRAVVKALGMNDYPHWEQGFIDQYDQFLNREDAKRIALANGQTLIGEDWGKQLFSENLH